MAEGFREWGDYGAEEQWQNRPPIKKVFSFRTLKRLLKIFFIAVLLVIYGIIAYRMITGLSVPKDATKLLWTEKALSAYGGGDLAVYVWDPDPAFSDDGRFFVYQTKYIPKTEELQLTVRYNRATVKALRADASPSDVDDEPFAFVLRDDKGRLYTNYSYSSFTKGLYTYVRLSFDGVSLFDTDTAPSHTGDDAPDEKYSDIIYKGAYKSDEISSDISHLYIDFYYENDVKYENGSWADPIFVYKSSITLSEYDLSKDAPSGEQNDIVYVSVKETN